MDWTALPHRPAETGGAPPQRVPAEPPPPEDDAWTAAMRRGDFARAWDIAEASIAARDPATRDDPALPYHQRWVWDGRRLDGASVLVRCYHGLGDSLMFARYLPLLARRAAHVTVEMQPRLIPLFARFPGIDRLVPFDQTAPLPPHERDIEIMDLALALRTGPQAVRPPYLNTAPAQLPPGTVGLCWRAGDWDDARSVPEGLMAMACDGPTLSLVADQTTLPVLNPAGCPMDMMQTAQLVAGCALVITVDTMIAHLAGALGRPALVLLKHAPDWRWPVGASRTPWYPDARLYRQPGPGDWDSVLTQVAADLAAWRLSGHLMTAGSP